MVPGYDHQALARVAERDGYSAAMLSELCRVPVLSVEASFRGERESVELTDLLRVAGTVGLTMRQLFPWARPEPAPVGHVDFEILLMNRKRRWFRVVDNYPQNGRESDGRAVCAAAAAGV